MVTNETIGATMNLNHIKQILNDEGVPMRSFAERTGYDKSCIIRNLNGKTAPCFVKAIVFAQVLEEITGVLWEHHLSIIAGSPKIYKRKSSHTKPTWAMNKYSRDKL